MNYDEMLADVFDKVFTELSKRPSNDTKMVAKELYKYMSDNGLSIDNLKDRVALSILGVNTEEISEDKDKED